MRISTQVVTVGVRVIVVHLILVLKRVRGIVMMRGHVQTLVLIGVETFVQTFVRQYVEMDCVKLEKRLVPVQRIVL